MANNDSTSCSRASVKPSSTRTHSRSAVGSAGRLGSCGKAWLSVISKECDRELRALQGAASGRLWPVYFRDPWIGKPRLAAEPFAWTLLVPSLLAFEPVANSDRAGSQCVVGGLNDDQVFTQSRGDQLD